MSIFSRIAAGSIPSYRIAENERFFAFLDISPLREGHVLVIPKEGPDKFFDMSPDLLAEILVFAQPIAHAIEKAFDCNRCGLAVLGLEVPHAHLHLLPVDGSEDIDFRKPKLKLSEAQFREVQEKILRQLV